MTKASSDLRQSIISSLPFLKVVWVRPKSGCLPYASILRFPQMIWVLERDGGMIHWHGKTEELGEKPVPVPLCPPQILNGLTWRANPDLRGERPTTNDLSHGTTVPHSLISILTYSDSCGTPTYWNVFTDCRPARWKSKTLSFSDSICNTCVRKCCLRFEAFVLTFSKLFYVPII
jgi:hypothetical protein